MSVRVRYAPSPTGSPHVGNIRTAIFNWLFAKKMGGKFIARLEDTDQERLIPEATGDIEQSLIQLGITPDEWWKTGGDFGPYVQSERLDLYKDYAQQLIDSGWAYRCYATPEELAEMRAQQQARGLPTGYDRRYRFLSPEDRKRYEEERGSWVVRLAVPLEGKTTYTDQVYGEITFENKLIDDQVLLKANGWPTYHLAVVVDDHLMEISHVIRGEDWQPSTPKQVLLYRAFGWEMPVWAHVPLIIGTDRKKLSKRHGATQFTEFIREGYLTEALFNFLCLMGWSSGEENRELFSRDEMVERFSLDSVSRNPAVFDYDKLKWMNGDYIRGLSDVDLAARCIPYLREAGFAPEEPTQEEADYIAKVTGLVRDRLKVLSEVGSLSEFFFKEPQSADDKAQRKWLSGETAYTILDSAVAALEQLDDEFTVEAIEAAVNSMAESGGLDRAPIIHTLRVATTGRTVGPGLFELLSLLGKSKVLARLGTARSWVVIPS